MREKYNLATQVSFGNLSDDTIGFYIENLKKSGADLLLLSVCEFFCIGEEREKQLSDLKKYIGKFRDEGFEPVIWTNSLGWGEVRQGVFGERFANSTVLRNFEGSLSGAVCSLDEVFSDAMAENVRDFIRAGAKTILWDDDLVQSVRPGAFCCCEKHLEKLKEKTGMDFTPEEVRDLFTGKPSRERSAYLEITGESLYAFCRKMRKAADELDCSVRMGLCASYTHYDTEGVDIEKMISILAGEKSEPFFRLSGAAYWPVIAPRFPDQQLGDVMEFVRMQASWLADSDILLLDENDPYPRDSETVKPYYCELYDKTVLTLPYILRNKYFLCFKAGENKDGYLNAHIENIQRDAKIKKIFERTVPAGVRIFEAQRKLEDAHLPEKYEGHGKLMADFSQPFSGVLFTRNCMPTAYVQSGAAVVFGENARHLNKSVTDSGMILDGSAADILADNGFDFGKPVNEYRDNEGNIFARTYENSSGIRTARLTFSASARPFEEYSFFPSGKTVQDTLVEMYNFVSHNAPLPFVKYSPDIYTCVSADEAGGSFSVLLCNMGNEEKEDVTIEGFTADKILLADGEWINDGGTLRCTVLHAHDFAAVKIKIR